jgi:alanyl-tRNA synthetase
MAATDHLYYRDATIREFTGRVVEVAQRNGRSSVALNRSAFYPTSGGQPNDLGTLADVAVLDVIEVDGTIWHVLDGAAPPVGSDVVGTIDPARREDHTQQHTGQHVLSQAFEQTAGLRTVSFHLGAESCTIDLDRASVAPEEVGLAEELANRIVLEDRPILIHFAAADDLERFGLRKPTERTGEVRIVEIEGFDRSACGGTHVQRTGQIGPIKVRRWERRGETTRVEFLCGWRALRDYSRRLEVTRALADRLSVGDGEVGAAVSRLRDDLDQLRTEVTALRDERLDREASDLVAVARPIPGRADVRLVRASFAERSPDDLKRLALRLVPNGRVVALLGATSPRASLVFAQSPGLPFDLGAALRRVVPRIGGRGGGTKDLAQGGGPAPGPVDEALDAAESLLQG